MHVHFKNQDFIEVVSSGMLLGIGFLLPSLWFLALIGIVPLLIALRSCGTMYKALFYGWCVSCIVCLIALAPIFWSALPLDWYGIGAVWIQWCAVGVSWVFASAALALGGAMFGACVHWYASDSWKDIFIIPSAWVISEWLGSVLFSVIAAGPGSLIGAHFTFAYIGYVLANDPVLLQLARFGDVYALSFAAIFVGTVLYRLLVTHSAKERRILYIYAGVLVLIWIAAHPLVLYFSSHARNAVQNSPAALNVAVLSRYAPPLLTPSPAEEERRFEELRAIIKPLRGIDVLVFPENAVYLRSIQQSGDSAGSDELQQIGRGGTQPLIIDSEDFVEPGDVLYSQLAYTGVDGNSVYSYKQFLLPLGEYMPYVYRFVIPIVGGENLLEKILSVRGYAQGPFEHIASVRGIALAARFCDEVMSPELYRQQVLQGAQILVNISSQSWFHGSPLVYAEMQAVARVRAVASARWYVQSGNMAPAFILDQYGQTVEETTWGNASSLTALVPAVSTIPPATNMGEFVLLIPLFFLFASIFSDTKMKLFRGM